MAKPLSWLAGAGLGAGLMYLCDPERGHRRRTPLRDQARHSMGKANKAAMLAARDAANRLYGNLAEAASSLWHKQVSDEVLEERSALQTGPLCFATFFGSRGCSPRAGNTERKDTSQRDRSFRVRPCSRFTAYKAWKMSWMHWIPPAELPALRARDERLNTATSTGRRLRWVAGTAGAALVANSLAHRSPWALMLGTCGLGLCTRAVTNRNGRNLLGLTDEAGGIRMHKTITIDAPVEQVFELFSDPLNLPRLSSTVKSVRALGGNRYEKTVAGPAGRDVVLTETITRCEPNEHLAWESAPASAVRYHGWAQFASHDNRQTQVTVSLTYHPPGGLLSHAAARLFGAGSKSPHERHFVAGEDLLGDGTTAARLGGPIADQHGSTGQNALIDTP